jgi:hypothetical protein
VIFSNHIYVCVVKRFSHDFVIELRKTSYINMSLIDKQKRERIVFYILIC